MGTLTFPLASGIRLSLSSDLLAPSNDLVKILPCFNNVLALFDLRSPYCEFEVLFDRYPLEDDFEKFSAPPRD